MSARSEELEGLREDDRIGDGASEPDRTDPPHAETTEAVEAAQAAQATEAAQGTEAAATPATPGDADPAPSDPPASHMIATTALDRPATGDLTADGPTAVLLAGGDIKQRKRDDGIARNRFGLPKYVEPDAGEATTVHASVLAAGTEAARAAETAAGSGETARAASAARPKAGRKAPAAADLTATTAITRPSAADLDADLNADLDAGGTPAGSEAPSADSDLAATTAITRPAAADLAVEAAPEAGRAETPAARKEPAAADLAATVLTPAASVRGDSVAEAESAQVEPAQVEPAPVPAAAEPVASPLAAVAEVPAADADATVIAPIAAGRADSGSSTGSGSASDVEWPIPVAKIPAATRTEQPAAALAAAPAAGIGQDVASETARAMAEAAGDDDAAGTSAALSEAGPDAAPADGPAADGKPPRKDRHTFLYGRGVRVLPWKHKSRLDPRQRKRRRIVVGTLWSAFLVFFGTVGWSVAQALTAPGTDTVQVRLAEWGRDHGLGGVVSTLEKWQYDLDPPKKGGTVDQSQFTDLGPTAEPARPSGKPTKGGAVAPPADVIAMRPNLAGPPGLTLDAGEGVFHPAVSTPDGQPVIQLARIRPDAVYTSVTEDVLWVDQKHTKYVLHPGHEGGVNRQVPVPNQINADARPNLIGLFNGGFKISESNGGYYDHGVTVAPLKDGAASEVIFADGRLAVGVWGRDYSFAKNPDIVSVRQNLKLMVDDSKVVPYINDAGNWGRSDHGSAAVWRSGVGITAAGDIVYVGGNDLTAPSLANLLQRAGAMRAMQLDINLRWAEFQIFPNRDGNPETSKLWGDFIQQGPNKFFADSTKDFMAIYLR